MIVTVPPTLAGADPLRPAAARAARPAHPAGPDGLGDQVHGGLRPAVLARRGADRAGDERHRAGQGRPSTTRRPTARPASCSASSRARPRELAPRSPGERRDAVLESFERYFGAQGRARRDRLLRQELGRGPLDPRLLRGLHPPGVLLGFGKAMRAPIGPIHWAGTETATRVERLHGRRDPVRRARRRRGAVGPLAAATSRSRRSPSRLGLAPGHRRGPGERRPSSSRHRCASR